MKPRFYFIVGIIVLSIIVALAWAGAASNTPETPDPNEIMPTAGPEILTFTVSGDVGIEVIKVVNLNTPGPATMRLTVADLPGTYNFNKNDVLVFNVTAKEGFTFDHWVIDDGTWQSNNPLTIKPSNSFSMIAKCLTMDQGDIIG